MKTRKWLWLVIFLVSAPHFSMADITSNTRLLQHPEWDGALVSRPWLKGEVRYQDWDGDRTDVSFLTFSPTYITRLPEFDNLELGSRLWLIKADYDNVFEDEFGLGDIDVWAKYQFLNSGRTQLSGGLLFTLPSGDEAILHPHASGEINIEFFCAGRYQTTSPMSLIYHAGIRTNSDAEYDLELSSGWNVSGERDGETQLMVGGGILYPLSDAMNFLGELNFASEPYDDFDSDSALTGGIEYKLAPNTTFNGGVAIGLDDGAPDYELIIGMKHLF